jgi:hypothetical protein
MNFSGLVKSPSLLRLIQKNISDVTSSSDPQLDSVTEEHELDDSHPRTNDGEFKSMLDDFETVAPVSRSIFKLNDKPTQMTKPTRTDYTKPVESLKDRTIEVDVNNLEYKPLKRTLTTPNLKMEVLQSTPIVIDILGVPECDSVVASAAESMLVSHNPFKLADKGAKLSANVSKIFSQPLKVSFVAKEIDGESVIPSRQDNSAQGTLHATPQKAFTNMIDMIKNFDEAPTEEKLLYNSATSSRLTGKNKNLIAPQAFQNKPNFLTFAQVGTTDAVAPFVECVNRVITTSPLSYLDESTTNLYVVKSAVDNPSATVPDVETKATIKITDSAAKNVGIIKELPMLPNKEIRDINSGSFETKEKLFSVADLISRNEHAAKSGIFAKYIAPIGKRVPIVTDMSKKGEYPKSRKASAGEDTNRTVHQTKITDLSENDKLDAHQEARNSLRQLLFMPTEVLVGSASLNSTGIPQNDDFDECYKAVPLEMKSQLLSVMNTN